MDESNSPHLCIYFFEMNIRPVLFCFALLLSTIQSYTQQCTPIEEMMCNPNASYCDPSVLENTFCDGFRFQAFDGYWSFVGDGGFVNINVVPAICLPGPPPGDGITAQLLETCVPVTALPTPSHNPIIINFQTQPCKVYTLYVSKVPGCSCNEIHINMTNTGGAGPPTLNGPINFDIAGEACACNTIQLCADINSDCPPYFEWEVDGIPDPFLGNNKCINYEIPGPDPIEICATAILGNPSNPDAICDQVKRCTTIIPTLRPPVQLPKEYVCWERHMGAGYPWQGQLIFESCIDPPCAVIQRGPDGCCFELTQQIVLRPQPPVLDKEIVVCDSALLPYVTEDGQKFTESVCDEYIFFKNPDTQCDTSYFLDLIIINPDIDVRKFCLNPTEIQLNAEFSIKTGCGLDSLDKEYSWIDCNTNNVISRDSFIVVNDTGSYVLRTEVFYYNPLTMMVESCIRESGKLKVTEDDFQNVGVKGEGDQEICIGDTAHYRVTNAGKEARFNWSITQGNGNILYPIPGDSSQIIIDWQLAGGDTGIVCVQLNEECVSGDTCFVITAQEFLVPDAGPDSSICGLEFQLNGSGSGTGLWNLHSGPGSANFSDSSHGQYTCIGRQLWGISVYLERIPGKMLRGRHHYRLF